MTADLEARARWHLELWDRDLEPPMTEAERRAYEDDEFDGGYLDYLVTCWACNGDGTEVTCVDDICNSIGYCMHGDGDEPCHECGGEGVL